MPVPFDDINWASKYEKWSTEPFPPTDFVGRPGHDFMSSGDDESRFDALEAFNNDYDVRTFLEANPAVTEQLYGGIPQNMGDVNYVKMAMEKFHSKPTELGGMGNGGSFSSSADYAGVARESMQQYLEDFLPPNADDIVEDTVEEALPDPWWKEEDESPERQEKLNKAEEIVSDRLNTRLSTWTGDKYDARKDNAIELSNDINDPTKEIEAMDFANDFKKKLLTSMGLN